MTNLRFLLASVTLGMAGVAHAQIDPGAGGRIDEFTNAPPPYQFIYTTPAKAYNANPANRRYFDNVYATTLENGQIDWTDDFAGLTQAGHKVFKAQVSKPGSGVARAEIVPKWEYVKSGVRWYAISVFLPHDWVITENVSMIVGQLHTSQKNAILSPPVALDIKGKYLNLELQTSELTDDMGANPHLERLTSSSQSIRLAAIDKMEARDKWYCFVMRADWSNTPGIGSFKLWMNGVLKYESTNAMNAYVTATGNYAKTGLYVPGISGMPDSQTIYTDYVYVAGAETIDQADLLAKTPCAN